MMATRRSGVRAPLAWEEIAILITVLQSERSFYATLTLSITLNSISITMIIKLKLTLLTALHYRRSIYTWQCSYHQHHLEIMSIIPFTILQSNRSFYTRQLDNIYNIDRIQTLQDKQFHKTVLIFVSHFATSMIYTQTKTKWRILCFHRFANTQMLWIITGLQIHCIIFMAGDH